MVLPGGRRHDWTGATFEGIHFTLFVPLVRRNSEGRQQLRDWRETSARRSTEIVELWEHVLSRQPHALGDELWNTLEQVCIAALDSARMDIALECIRTLSARFPKSNRVLRLQAMRFEALDDFEKAAQLYDQLIEAEPTSGVNRKRKIAMQLARGDRLGAIRDLNQYLKVFLNDLDAWQQLSELFVAEADYAKAAHCLEEVLLSHPTSTAHLIRLADVRYTAGGAENWELARAYYERALHYDPSSLRALYGLVLACNALAKSTTLQRKRQLAAQCADALDRIHARFEEGEEDEDVAPPLKGLAEALAHMKIQAEGGGGGSAAHQHTADVGAANK